MNHPRAAAVHIVMRRKVSALVVVLGLVGLAACGSSSKPTPTGSPPTTAATSGGGGYHYP